MDKNSLQTAFGVYNSQVQKNVQEKDFPRHSSGMFIKYPTFLRHLAYHRNAFVSVLKDRLRHYKA